MKSYIGWIIIVCFFATLIAGFFILKKDTSGAPPDFWFATTTSAMKIQEATPLGLKEVPSGYKEYRNTDYGFSVYYPGEDAPQEFHDRGYALTVSFQGAPGKPGFQIYVAPINGTKITSERFNMDEPSGIMKEPHDIQIDGVPAVTFFGFDAHVGQTREVWFIHNGFLFEVTTYKELDSWFSQILSTFLFI